MHVNSRMTLKAGATVIGALAIVGAIAASSTAAATTYTVAVGSTKSGTATLSGTSNGALHFVDTTTGLPASCSSATAGGTAKLTATAKAAKLAQITKSSFTGCNANGQLPLAVKQSGKWAFNATGPTSGGVTPGTLSKISTAVNDTAGFGCKFTLSGTVDASYNNNGTLAFAPLSGTSNYLIVSKQSGNCLGLANNGDKVSFTGSFAVSSTKPSGALTITSN